MVAPAETGGGDEFFSRYAYWKRLLDEGGAEAATRFGDQMIGELDLLCHGFRELCDFSSKDAIFPDILSDERPRPVQYGAIESAKGMHNGMRLLEDDGKPRLWYEFILHDVTEPVSVVEGVGNRLFTYLNPEETTVTTRSDFEGLFKDSTITPVADELVPSVLEQASDTFAATIVSKRFRKLPHQAQREFVTNYLARFEAETGITEKAIALGGTYFYAAAKNGAEVRNKDIRALNDELLQGLCVSLGFLENGLLEQRPIRHKRDLVDRLAGLCLVVEIGDFLPELSLCKGDIVYVPLSSQPIEAHIAPKNAESA